MFEGQAAASAQAIGVRLRATRRSGRLPWSLLAAAVAGSALLLGLSLHTLRVQQIQRGNLVASIAVLDAQVQANKAKAETTSAATGVAAPTDFVSKLPVAPDVRPLLFEIERATARAGVAFGSMQVQARAATTEQLSRTEATVSLRGNYPGLKLAMLDVLGRFPNATLVQWRLRRVAQPTDLEATMVVALWGAASGSPVPASGLVMPSGVR